MSGFKIFIFCDDPSHKSKRVAVTNFVAVPDGGWHEEPSSRASREQVGTGYHLIGDEPATTGWALDPDVRNRDVRSDHELMCRKCKRRPLPVRAENLYPVLDDWRAAGVSELALQMIAASLQRKSIGQATSNPEPGQG